MKENNKAFDGDGGYLLPETALVYNAKDGLIWFIVRKAGQWFISFGSWLRAFGYEAVEIHPRASLLQAMRNVERK